LVAQRFTRSAAAKRSALPQTAKPRPLPPVLPRRLPSASTGRGDARAHRSWGRHSEREEPRGSSRRHSGGDDSRGGRGIAAVIAYAWAQVGKPYILGSDGPGAFDCSGLTMQAYKRAGITLPHSSGDQASMARTVSRAEARPGDLVVGPGHIGIYLGDGMMIDAGNSRVGVVYREVYAGLHFERL
jgi:cell wall-associated NlpC family hydrolase